MRTRGSMGWVFLAIVLAVPAVMYYKSYMAKDREAKLADKAKVRVPEGPLFPEPADSRKFKNPIALDPAAPAGAPGAGAVVSTETASQTAAAVADAAAPQTPAPQSAPGPQPAAQSSPAPAQPAAAGAPPAPTDASAPAPGPQPAAAPSSPEPSQPAAAGAAPAPADAAAPVPTTPPAPPAPGQAASAPEVAASTADIVAVDWRDPLLSPYDQFLLEQEELEKLIKRKEVEEQALRAKVQKEKPVEQTLSLQGIVTTPDGNKAIINNDMYGEGEWVGNSGIKVVKISQTGVTFTHKGKTFSKRMQ